MPDDRCDLLGGSAEDYCRRGDNGSGGGGGGAGNDSVTNPLDPLSSLAHSTAKAAAWVARQLGDLVDTPTKVDFTNPGFVQQYALVFAASVFLVLAVWLGAVIKRVVRGVGPAVAFGEAIGLLWVSVVVTAFAPAALYTVVGATDGISRGLSSGHTSVFDALANGLTHGHIGGGPIMLIVVSLLTIALCGCLMLLMILRTLGLYVGALLGIPIHASLVDKDWWSASRRWVGFMAGLILVEPVIVIVVGLAGAVQARGDIVTGVGITAIALCATVALITRVPGWGDTVAMARATARGAGSAAGAVVGGGSAATGVRQGISTHSGRDQQASGDSGSSGGGSKEPSGGGVTGGIAAHAQRSKRTGGSGTSGDPGSAPLPRRSEVDNE